MLFKKIGEYNAKSDFFFRNRWYNVEDVLAFKCLLEFVIAYLTKLRYVMVEEKDLESGFWIDFTKSDL